LKGEAALGWARPHFPFEERKRKEKAMRVFTRKIEKFRT
jgi:hypothetical protein